VGKRLLLLPRNRETEESIDVGNGLIEYVCRQRVMVVLGIREKKVQEKSKVKKRGGFRLVE
jgi:hypothetical protein